MTTITSQSGLHEWLQEHFYFEEGYCLALEASESSSEEGDISQIVRVELGYQIGGGSMAGDYRILKVFACTAYDVSEFIPGQNSDSYLDAGVTLIDQSIGLGLNLGVRGKIICRRFEIEQLPDRPLRIDPQIDPTTVFTQVPQGKFPAAFDWITWFSQRGQDVVWRVYGGDVLSMETTPADSYSGFLQRRVSIAHTTGGIFLEVRKASGSGFTVLVCNQQTAKETKEIGMWLVMAEVLSQFSEAQFRTGNCLLTSNQWLKLVREGTLPTIPEHGE